MSRFQIGDRVRLVKVDPAYGKDKSNTIGNTGTVQEVYTQWTRVKWDNGSCNSFQPGELELIEVRKYKDE